MPPRQRVTKEMILQQAFQIAKEKGIDAVTARSVAKKVGCSIQPIFSQFETMEELRQGTFEYVCERLMEDIMKLEGDSDFLAKTNIWIINLARNEPHLFHLLYLSNNYTNNNLFELMMAYESNKVVFDKMMDAYGLDIEMCKDIFTRGFLFLFGVTAMVSTNHMNFTDEQITSMMKQTVSDIICGAKEQKEGAET